MGSAAVPRVGAHPGAGACARLVGEVEQLNAARNAEIVAGPTGWKYANEAAHSAIVNRIAGPDGGFLTFRSSPFVMWLASRLTQIGEGAVAAVDDDQEEWRRIGWRR